MASLEDRRYVSRVFHRFGFGPKPGEFSQALIDGPSSLIARVLAAPQIPISESIFTLQGISDLGPQPAPNTPAIIDYSNQKRMQLRKISSFWLGLMIDSDNQLLERMNWFWHGHWATSYQKVDEPYVMLKQLLTMRNFSLGSYSDFASAMIVDGALIYWLDGQLNTIKAPNENLSREMMELFTLGVNRYTEDDVKQSAKVLTGYKVEKSSGNVTFIPSLHYAQPIQLLNSVQTFDGPSLAKFLVARDDCATFIAERIWFRSVTTKVGIPSDGSLQKGFSDRNISSLISAILRNPSFNDPSFSQVKSPVEWLVGTMRALSLSIDDRVDLNVLLNALDALGQRPFFPPNVGGWPADEAWLSTSSAQTRLALAQYLVTSGDLSQVSAIPRNGRIAAIEDWLGIVGFGDRTRSALNGAITDVPRLVTLALCSPEYLVNA